MALDIALNALLKSSDFYMDTNKNWSLIAQHVPGYTPRQIMHRYEILKQDYDLKNPTRSKENDDSAKLNRKSKLSDMHLTSVCDNSSKAIKNGSPKGIQSVDMEHDMGFRYSYLNSKVGTNDKNNPIMVIHVCDEAKNLKQDFHCARDLLIREMKYFCEYLSTDAQRWEEVDISVHCDIQIFDWLMKYVQCSTNPIYETPPLETTNVISILISSDFLKMQKLVEACIQFCHTHITAIIATPCNMSCINDKLVRRISERFSDSQIDDIRDRKDKFKSKLFAKQIEKLFDPKSEIKGENATTLFRCVSCKKLMTETMMYKVKCHKDRLTVNKKGKLAFEHQRDNTWDVNQYLLDLKSSLFNWRDVYWRLWGTVNYLKCTRCNEYFSCIEYSHCLYHTDKATYAEEGNSIVGRYDCCGEAILRFDPTKLNTGCQSMDHVIMTSKTSEGEGSYSNRLMSEAEVEVQKVTLNVLLAHRDVICTPYVNHTDNSSAGNKDSSCTSSSTTAKSSEKMNVFQTEEINGNLRWDLKFLTGDLTGTDEIPKPQPEMHRVESKTNVKSMKARPSIAIASDLYGDSEEDEDENPDNGGQPNVVNFHTVLLNAPEFSSSKLCKWDTCRSLRWNQDSQREEDQIRMRHYVSYLSQLRPAAKNDKSRNQREFHGGIYSKLYSQWNTNWYNNRNANVIANRTKQKLNIYQQK